MTCVLLPYFYHIDANEQVLKNWCAASIYRRVVCSPDSQQFSDKRIVFVRQIFFAAGILWQESVWLKALKQDTKEATLKWNWNKTETAFFLFQSRIPLKRNNSETTWNYFSLQSCFRHICIIAKAFINMQILKLFHACLNVDSVVCVDRPTGYLAV